MDYSATDKHKSGLIRYDHAAGYTSSTAIRYASTSALTSIYIYKASGSMSAGSTFALYGIAA